MAGQEHVHIFSWRQGRGATGVHLGGGALLGEAVSWPVGVRSRRPDGPRHPQRKRLPPEGQGSLLPTVLPVIRQAKGRETSVSLTL